MNELYVHWWERNTDSLNVAETLKNYPDNNKYFIVDESNISNSENKEIEIVQFLLPEENIKLCTLKEIYKIEKGNVIISRTVLPQITLKEIYSKDNWWIYKP